MASFTSYPADKSLGETAVVLPKERHLLGHQVFISYGMCVMFKGQLLSVGGGQIVVKDELDNVFFCLGNLEIIEVMHNEGRL